jgi:uncharacterized protein YgbK (DUF1537 family)
LSRKHNILLAFYGDDLTGSTDALEFICRAGAKSVLFLEPPSPEQLKNYTGLQAYGIAGLTRSLSPAKMEEQLVPAFQMMKESGVRHIHYKVCSTFDSSPQIGSIGKAMDCGAEIFPNDFIPVLGGMPALGRYCVFGNLFARMGIGSNGKIYRLDRHPSMSRHPVTPANESDLRIHLQSQTKKRIGCIDIITIEKSVEQWNEVIRHGDKVVVLDALTDNHIGKIGEWLDAQAKADEPLFSVGSSGIEMALGKFWNSKGILHETKSWQEVKPVTPLLVVSGSCSPVTAAQIKFARSNGFEEIVLDAGKICENGMIEECVINEIIQTLQSEKDVVVHTGSKNGDNLSSEILGRALGTIAKQAVTLVNLKRVVIAGGDTSSYAARAMEIEALEMVAPLVSGAPLCKAYSKNKNIDGAEVNLKGGQVGADNYFMILKEGTTYAV